MNAVRWRYLWVLLGAAILACTPFVLYNYERSSGLERIESRLTLTGHQLEAIAEHLRIYARSSGHYPSNDEGLAAVKTLTAACDSDPARPWGPLRYCRFFRGQVLSPWGEPFIYENRQNISYYKFQGSMAGEEQAGRFSIEVDRDVYVWSLAAAQAADDVDGVKRTSLTIRLLAYLLAGLCFGMFIRGCFAGLNLEGRDRRRTIIGRLAGGAGAGALLGFSLMTILFGTVRTCYDWARAIDRSPKLTRDYIRLITKYRDNGAISDTAYRKILDSLKEQPPNVD